MNIDLLKEFINIVNRSNHRKIHIKIINDNYYSVSNFDETSNEIACSVNNEVYTNIISKYVGIVKLIDSNTHKPIVTLQQKVNRGDLLCIIEHLNIPIPIKSNIPGYICEISVKNGTIVDYGKKIMKIKSII